MSIIWLPNRKYKDKQTTKPGFSHEFYNNGPINYVVCKIKKEYVGERSAKSLEFKFAADTACFIYVNGKLVCNTNNKPAADFYLGDRPQKNQYWANQTVAFDADTKVIDIVAYVQMSSIRLFDFSSGKGGFALEGCIHYEDGSITAIESDNTWDIRLENVYNDHHSYDATKENGPWEKAEIKKYDWILEDTNIKMTGEQEVEYPNHFVIKAHGKKKYVVDFPLVYSAYYFVECQGKGIVKGTVDSFETKNDNSKSFNTNHDVFTFKGDGRVRYFDLHSVGGFVLELENDSDASAEIIIHVYHAHYPFAKVGTIETNNKHLNDIFKKSTYAAVNCSQTMLLDSPQHCEPFASCSGDYHIISMVESFATGDYDLSKHVIKGYADSLARNGGNNANDDYALINIIWLWDMYEICGDKELLKGALRGSETTIKLYGSFVGEEGIIDHPRRYCFIDWVNVDGQGLFSAPCNLGQSVVNMFYYKALVSMSKIYDALGEEKKAKRMASKAKRLKKGINAHLYDKERGLYFEGENRQYEIVDSFGIPHSNGKIYFRKHANVLAVAYGLTTSKRQSRSIVNKIFGELKDCEIQPYFMHYLFEAVHQADMDGKYAMKVLKEWTSHVKISDKGFPEGFVKPQPDYIFDFSHAWACSPYYSFIIASSGLKILEPGMKKLSFSPNALRLSHISYSIPTPYGDIQVKMNKGQMPIIAAPEEIEINID